MITDPFLVYLVRHAIAAERGPEYPDDRDRPLTHQGAARFRKAAKGLVALDIRIERILTSPLVRARQTAEILGEAFPKASTIEVEALAPGGTYRGVLSALGEQRDSHHLALVGHEPDMGDIAARLLGARGTLEFKKGAVCAIALGSIPPTAPGTLLWFATPKMLRSIG